MIFSEEDLTSFELFEHVYPIRCDLVVLEKIQNHTGDILVAEDKLRGFIPERVEGSPNIVDRTAGVWTIPDIDMTTQSLLWMIEEGKRITDGDYDIPTLDDLKVQDEYTITELALIVFKEFESCISGSSKKKSKSRTKRATTT